VIAWESYAFDETMESVICHLAPDLAPDKLLTRTPGATDDRDSGFMRCHTGGTLYTSPDRRSDGWV
jgi:hypothetical protein